MTGLSIWTSDPEDLHKHFDTVESRSTAVQKDLCPGSAALEKINAGCGDALAPGGRLTLDRKRLNSHWRIRAHRPEPLAAQSLAAALMQAAVTRSPKVLSRGGT